MERLLDISLGMSAAGPCVNTSSPVCVGNWGSSDKAAAYKRSE